jgi:hypothetical protein
MCFGTSAVNYLQNVSFLICSANNQPSECILKTSNERQWINDITTALNLKN